MAKRVEGKAAIVVGGGQTPGQTVGNGRATAIVLAREGAQVIVADRTLKAAQETVDLIRDEGGQAWAFEADITRGLDATRRDVPLVQRRAETRDEHEVVVTAATCALLSGEVVDERPLDCGHHRDDRDGRRTARRRPPTAWPRSSPWRPSTAALPST